MWKSSQDFGCDDFPCVLTRYDILLQIVMEYCGAGSVSDIMKIRNKTVSIKPWIDPGVRKILAHWSYALSKERLRATIAFFKYVRIHPNFTN